jgi:molecular chaperone GrpE (heat shock protein)
MSKNNKDDKRVPKKKLTEEEKEEIRTEQQNKELREHFDREQKFSELSKERGAVNHQSICKKFTLERLANELNSIIPSLNRILDKSEHDVRIIENHRGHVEEQHRRLFAFQSKIIDAIFSEFLNNKKLLTLN